MKTTNKKTAKRPRASIEAARPPFLPDRLITRDDLVEMIGVRYSQIWVWMTRGLFDFRNELVKNGVMGTEIIPTGTKRPKKSARPRAVCPLPDICH